jgi:hypothetical protein
MVLDLVLHPDVLRVVLSAPQANDKTVRLTKSCPLHFIHVSMTESLNELKHVPIIPTTFTHLDSVIIKKHGNKLYIFSFEFLSLE